VPFEFGRPLGAPDNIDFQKRVLSALLKLFEEPGGPCIIDFPEDAPEEDDDATILSCPVYYGEEKSGYSAMDETERALYREILAMRPWYDMAVKKRNRTTVGASKLDMESVGRFLYSFLNDREPENPRSDIGIGYAFKLAVEDLKAYYIEGITAQPGQENISGRALKEWFWEKTTAGRILLDLIEVCEKSNDKVMNMMSHFIAPGDIAFRKKNEAMKKE
jgi:hypothetical protein